MLGKFLKLKLLVGGWVFWANIKSFVFQLCFKYRIAALLDLDLESMTSFLFLFKSDTCFLFIHKKQTWKQSIYCCICATHTNLWFLSFLLSALRNCLSGYYALENVFFPASFFSCSLNWIPRLSCWGLKLSELYYSWVLTLPLFYKTYVFACNLWWFNLSLSQSRVL